MKPLALLSRLIRYGTIGGLAAAVHAGVLLILSQWMARSMANPIAFLAASLAGYLGHSLVTFREETGGRRFARRWLLLQYGVNLSVCALLPLLQAPTLALVFTPTLLNALIWNRAARFAAQQQPCEGEPAFHADDLGLAKGVDDAILYLASAHRLDGASLLVDGPTAAAAAAEWRRRAPGRTLNLHLCLTEGPPYDGCPDLPAGFGTLLLTSFWPSRRRRLRPQLRQVIRAQLLRFQHITQQQEVALDGHQHIHLVPLVLDVVLEQPDIRWIRTTREPIPTGLSCSALWSAARTGGALKWLVLQVLTAAARWRLRQKGVATNQHFAGVLFTGRMAGEPLAAATRMLGPGDLVLAHPADRTDAEALIRHQFPLSADFFASPWRRREWHALSSREPHG